MVVGQVTDGGLMRVITAKPSRKFPRTSCGRGPVYNRPLAAPAASNPKKIVRVCARRHRPYAELREAAVIAGDCPEALDHRAVRRRREQTLWRVRASDAAVVRIKDRRRTSSSALHTTDGNGRWCQLNPRVNAMHAVAEAARVAASGARPIAATNCLNFGSPKKPEVMWQFSQVIDGVGEACTALVRPSPRQRQLLQ
jgi:phosphoribosylformylglycinamidine synthase